MRRSARHHVGRLLALLLFVTLALSWAVSAPALENPTSDGPAPSPGFSHRVIVQFATPSVTEAVAPPAAASSAWRISSAYPAAATQRAVIEAEQSAFIANLPALLPGASVSSYVDDGGQPVAERWSMVINGLALDPGPAGAEAALKALSGAPGVKAVSRDRAHAPALYASVPLINAPAIWDLPAIGGQSQAGRGIKVASVDGGIHKGAPMFSGAGFFYPAGWPANGRGQTQNNNGKIIASRSYFRTWDPPLAGDENPWPGLSGTSHGVHTSGIMAGNPVTGSFFGLPLPVSGVAPAAWVMSYRVFYPSVTGNESMYDAEGISALEDAVADGADVINNSWGAGPISTGGIGDPLDTALANAWRAGAFVAMSAGNSGPLPGTLDHPSADYVTVAATTTDHYLAAGRISVTAPVPVPANLENILFGAAQFGPSFPMGQVTTGAFLAGERLVPANFEGCSPWPDGTFAGKVALVRRGTCNFSVKVYNAQLAGATATIIYNQAANGETVGAMAAGTNAGLVTIPSALVGNSRGVAMVAHYDTALAGGVDAVVAFDLLGYVTDATPDVVPSFSSRGPGAGGTLKPDIAAPGSNILSQGYGPEAGEGAHLGFGQASGTSMASPHVAGAAALLRQLRPTWSNAQVKSALMSTAKYLEVYTATGLPAQPLDMGAGRLDLTRAAAPGVFLDPPSLGFGMVTANGVVQRQVRVTSAATTTETYSVAAVDTSGGFTLPLPAMTGVTVSPASFTLLPGRSKLLTVSVDTALVPPAADVQGYVVIDGPKYQAHFPVWVRTAPAPADTILLIDDDGSSATGGGLTDYRSYYAQALTDLGLSYEVWDADALYGSTYVVPAPAQMASYRAVVHFTGDNYYPQLLNAASQARLTEFVNAGGRLVVMGQDVSNVMGSSSFLLSAVLGSVPLRDSVSANLPPPVPLVALPEAPPAFRSLVIDLSAGGNGALNQRYVDEMLFDPAYDPDRPWYLSQYRPLFFYPVGPHLDRGVTAMAHRAQPSLESEATSYPGRSVYTAFGLEGVNDDLGSSRASVLQTLLNYVLDEPSAGVEAVPAGADQADVLLTATFSSPVADATGASWRWDFGDGTGIHGPYDTPKAQHRYARKGSYVVRVEVTDSYGNRATGSQVRVVPGGSLTVKLGPAAARVAGARWRIGNGPWRKSGTTATNLQSGTQRVSFLRIPGWRAPAARLVLIQAGTSLTTTVRYRLVAP